MKSKSLFPNKRLLALMACAIMGSPLSALPVHAGMLDFLAPFTAPGAFPQSSSPQSVARMNAVKVYNSGVHELKNKNLKGAAECFQQALVFDPTMKEVHGALGQVLYDSGYYQDSFKEMQQATEVSPNDASAWCMLALSACHIQRYDVTLNAFQNYLKLKPHGGYAAEATRSVAILQHTVFSSPQTDDRNGNYFGDFPAANLRKWNSNMLPLRVYIAPGAGITGYTQNMENALRQSFNDWTVISEGRIQFALINDEANAQIICKWTADKNDLASSSELGVTHSKWLSNGNIQHADIIFLTVYESAPRIEDTERRAKAVYLHEIGHALGLSHSQEPWDIMYPLVAPSGLEFPLTLRDKNTLLALYNNDPTGLIAKRFDAAIAPGGGNNGGFNGGAPPSSLQAPNTVAMGFPPSGGNFSAGNLNGGVPGGAGGPGAFSQGGGGNGSPSSFAPPSRMAAPQMPPTTAYAPAPPQSAFSSANIPGHSNSGLSRSELNSGRAQQPPPSQSYAPPAPSYQAPNYGAASNYAAPANYGATPAYPTPPSGYPSSSNPFAQPAQAPYAGGGGNNGGGFQAQSFATGNVEKISALNRAAAQATARRDFGEAINRLQDAHRIAPTDQIICRNLGLALGNAANVAVQEGDFAKALQHYKDALDVLKTSADRSAYDQILSDYQAMVKRQSGH